MSASILKSLQKLNSAVEHLEGAVQAQAGRMAVANRREIQKAQSTQNDLFSQVAASQAAPSNFNAVNVRMLATRLDTAINQVEQILKEGRG